MNIPESIRDAVVKQSGTEGAPPGVQANDGDPTTTASAPEAAPQAAKAAPQAEPKKPAFFDDRFKNDAGQAFKAGICSAIAITPVILTAVALGRIFGDNKASA